MRRRDTIVGLGAALLVPGCASNSNNDQDEFAAIGRVGNSSEPPPGVFRPIIEGDLVGVQKRGAMLFNLQRALHLGYEHGAQAVGTAEGDIILPLVDVDPGGRSAQVLFVRWSRDRVGADGSLHPKYANRWLLVSLLLEPERVLDRELLAGDVGEDTVEFHRVAAMLSAAQALRSRAPGTSFHLFTVAELAPTKSRRTSSMIATRVYAMGVADDGPDYEVLVDQAKKSKIPDALVVSEVHAPGAIEGGRIRVPAAQPAPASVARIMSRGTSGPAEVESASGVWLVEGRTGLISRP
ncbi:MAG: hypothetical protein KUG77_25680 [Nannocystaceae bacterium]|nr:hypothetical protein [Nannocystaceae bacterium]